MIVSLPKGFSHLGFVSIEGPVTQDSRANWTPGLVCRYQGNFKPLFFYSITTVLKESQTLIWAIRIKGRYPAPIFGPGEDLSKSAILPPMPWKDFNGGPPPLLEFSHRLTLRLSGEIFFLVNIVLFCYRMKSLYAHLMGT